MIILLLGSGGREHALAWKLSQSERLTKLFAAPGNPGIAQHAECVDLDPTHVESVVAFAREENVGLVVIGPEAPLVAGLADRLRENGILTFGPNRAAAQLEGSKGFTKDLCQRENIPTAAYGRFRDAGSAKAALDSFGVPVVIKADGLAAGKGVVIAESRAQAENAIDDMFGGTFGSAGAEVVIEEFLTGEEASFFALTDGTTVVPFGSAQDHKRVGDGDTGPNTGGMGAYSPAPVLTPELEARTMREIVEPTVRAMAAAGIPYSGVLYAGLMLTAEGPKLIEYNARFGDPECQVLMLRLEDDLVTLMLAVAEGRLAELARPSLSPNTALTVVMAAKGYPGTPAKGGAIRNIVEAEAKGAKVFHAGTAEGPGGLVANGGRVLNVTAIGRDIGEARDSAYAAVDALDFASGFCRRDIGWRELARQRNVSAAAALD
ncbi:phosphoribosylamine--glycine ligase [Sphingomonas histidinilytica]|uniref:Phosphoribosylamine--glycine ligase n=1 Tax=Rhizorhabdus histidinilytica TaxID=439228 RepID=A0A1T5DCK2_9SPHN|nr:phosphoribosylamine--glycine ligase [Rhizorhabdus histidinilytica]MBO9379419.1 phosphoribosylamine--glycine ligase [Rhizorhabdus histidinilytica]SKB69444.1 phosphoribosylamine--glycine ligase [Rhizorhabdus histidinilytica]